MRSRLIYVRGRQRASIVCILAVIALWTIAGEAQKGGKPKPSLTGVSAVFGSNVSVPNVGASVCSDLPPGISGDGSVYGFDASSQTGAFLRSDADNDFVLKLAGSGPPFVYVNFASWFRLSGSSTLPEGFCDVVLSAFSFDTHVLQENGDDDPGLGLDDILPGQTHPSRIKAFFDYIDKDGNPRTYTIRFNQAGYPGSTNVAITRGPAFDPSDNVTEIAANQWVIQTGPYAPGAGDVAQLVSPALSKKGHPGPNDEGFYTLPFKIIVTLP